MAKLKCNCKYDSRTRAPRLHAGCTAFSGEEQFGLETDADVFHVGGR